MQGGQRPDGAPQQPSLQPHRLLLKDSSRQAHTPRLLGRHRGPNFQLDRLQSCDLAGNHLSRAAQRRRDAGVQLAQQRQQLQPHAVARIGQVTVALILARQQARSGAIRLGLGAGERQQRAQQAQVVSAPFARQRPASVGRHARQPFQPCPTQQVQQHRLGLIIGGVAHGHRPRADLLRHLHQEAVARLSRGVFQGKSSALGQNAHCAMLQGAGQPPFRAQRTHPGRVGRRGCSQAVIEVRHVQRQAKFERECAQGV